MYKKFIYGMAILVVAMSFAFKKNQVLEIQFSHFVGDRLLQLDSTGHINALGQTFSISMFKYYIGNIRLTKTDGTTVIFPDYHLINEENEDSKIIRLLGVPDGKYQSIAFTIGVDSIHNCSGLQTGALDPTNAMFWAWNTGYIFLKLEGNAAASRSPGHFFEYHIGGFRAPNNAIRNIILPFEKTLKLKANSKPIVRIKADVLAIFKSPTVIDFSKMSVVTDFHNAGIIADNYTNMFSILRPNQ